MRARFHPGAEADIEDATHYYRTHASSAIEASFVEEFARTLRFIQVQPEIGIAWDEGVRRLPMRRFPFSLFYVIRAEGVLVLAVAHHRRAPGYWGSRSDPT